MYILFVILLANELLRHMYPLPRDAGIFITVEDESETEDESELVYDLVTEDESEKKRGWTLKKGDHIDITVTTYGCLVSVHADSEPEPKHVWTLRQGRQIRITDTDACLVTMSPEPEDGLPPSLALLCPHVNTFLLKMTTLQLLSYSTIASQRVACERGYRGKELYAYALALDMKSDYHKCVQQFATKTLRDSVAKCELFHIPTVHDMRSLAYQAGEHDSLLLQSL
jgi:hypothetical protein